MDGGRALALDLRLEGTLVQEPFEDVFRRVLPRALRVAQRILGNETRAEDAAAEALARAHSSWHKVGSTSYCEAWILRVTANVAIDMSRRDRHLLPHAWDDQAEHDSRDDSEHAVTRIDLAAALASLPKRQREVVILQYLEGLTEAETALAMGVSPGTVKKNGFRARETLRKRLGMDVDRNDHSGGRLPVTPE